MSNEIEKLVAPLQELNAFAVSNIEKMTELQLKGITECADANVQALKSASAIKDVKDLQAYIDAQTAAAIAIAENAQANAWFHIAAENGNRYAVLARNDLATNWYSRPEGLSEINNMTNKERRDKGQPKSGLRLLEDRRNQNVEPDDLERPPDLERRSAQERRTQGERRKYIS